MPAQGATRLPNPLPDSRVRRAAARPAPTRPPVHAVFARSRLSQKINSPTTPSCLYVWWAKFGSPRVRVLVQPEMESGRSPLASIPPFGRGFFKASGSTDPIWSLRRAQRASSLRPVHRLDEPSGLSLSMVASPQCRFRLARQNHCSAAATSAANFRMRRNPTEGRG